MKMVKVIGYIFLLIVISCSTKKSSPCNTPNIIYILADDLGYGDLAVYNKNSKIKTPNLDQLAKEGMLFTDMHSTSSVCTPTRYSILTGEYAWRTQLKSGVLWSYAPLMIPSNKETVASLLKKKNYHTAVIGKWHLGLDWQLKNPLTEDQIKTNDQGLIIDYDQNSIDFSKSPSKGPKDIGFDYSYIIPASLDIPPYVYLENQKFTQPVNQTTQGSHLNFGNDKDFWRPGPMAEGFDFYDVLPNFIRKAKTYIDKVKDNKNPFFLYLPLPAPHTPWLPSDEFKNTSQAGMYGEYVQMVDEYVGQLLKHVEKQGISKKTMIVFTSDNGPFWRPHHIETFGHQAAGELRGMKGDVYDGGHRIPFILKWPGRVNQGTLSYRPNTLANFMATVAEMLNVTTAAKDSHSIYKELTDENYKPEIFPIVHHSSGGHFALRSGSWKLIEKWGSGGFSPPQSVATPQGISQLRLYSFEENLSEETDFAAVFPEQVETLQRQLDSIRSLK